MACVCNCKYVLQVVTKLHDTRQIKNTENIYAHARTHTQTHTHTHTHTHTNTPRNSWRVCTETFIKENDSSYRASLNCNRLHRDRRNHSSYISTCDRLHRGPSSGAMEAAVSMARNCLPGPDGCTSPSCWSEHVVKPAPHTPLTAVYLQ